MKALNVLAFAAAFSGAANLSPADEPCIPDDGQTHDVSFDRPPLGQEGDPVEAEWIDETGAPEGYDEDALFNDPMGPGTPGDPPDTASLPVENDGGNLSGPNGDNVNGGLDGDCAEIYMKWTYRYPVTISNCAGHGLSVGGRVGASSSRWECRSVTVWKEGCKRSSPKDVCPC